MPSPASVRRATLADSDEILRVVNLAYRVEAFFIKGDRIALPDLQERLARPGMELLVIDGAAPGALVAAVQFEHRGDHGWFGLLAVDPACQGQGHARALISAIENRCRALGLPMLEICVVDLRQELPAFYAQFGFSETGREPFPDIGKLTRAAGLIVMRKPVGQV